MTAQCLVCGREQDQGLLCDRVYVSGHDESCTARIERVLAEVPSLLTELDTALSKQAKLGGGGKGGLARERSPINLGAVGARSDIDAVLVGWARDLSNDQWRPATHYRRRHRSVTQPYAGPFCTIDCGHPSCERMSFWDTWAADDQAHQAARLMLDSLPAIRRHPAVDEMFAEIIEAIDKARHVIDRAPDRVYVGPCWQDVLDEFGNTVVCTEPLNARPGASEVRCKACGSEHEIDARRTWLISEASKAVVTAREAARYLIKVGNLEVSETNIRNWVGRGKVKLRPGLSTQRQFELGALLDYIATRVQNSPAQDVAGSALAV